MEEVSSEADSLIIYLEADQEADLEAELEADLEAESLAEEEEDNSILYFL